MYNKLLLKLMLILLGGVAIVKAGENADDGLQGYQSYFDKKITKKISVQKRPLKTIPELIPGLAIRKGSPRQISKAPLLSRSKNKQERESNRVKIFKSIGCEIRIATTVYLNGKPIIVDRISSPEFLDAKITLPNPTSVIAKAKQKIANNNPLKSSSIDLYQTNYKKERHSYIKQRDAKVLLTQKSTKPKPPKNFAITLIPVEPLQENQEKIKLPITTPVINWPYLQEPYLQPILLQTSKGRMDG